MKKHTVEKGESLWKLSQIYYGSGSFWRTIYAVNIDIIDTNPDLIKEGVELTIPDRPYSQGKALKQEIGHIKSLLDRGGESKQVDLMQLMLRLEEELMAWRMARLIIVLGSAVSIMIAVKLVLNFIAFIGG